MELWIVRHGETVDNIKHVLQGQQPGKLSESGIHQAKLTGRRLCSENFDEIYCSDLGRTKETLHHILEAFPNRDNITPNYCPLIREKGFGVLEGHPREHYKRVVKESGIPEREYKPEGGESWNEAQQRAHQFLELMANKYAKKESKVLTTIGQSVDEDTSEAPRQSKEGEESQAEENKEASPVEKTNNSTLDLKESKEDERLLKILVVTHRGYLTELSNVINYKKSKQAPATLAEWENCGINIVRFYTEKNRSEAGDVIEYDLTVKDEISHLK